MSSILPMAILATGLFYVNEPVVDMRESPAHESGIASQALFAEEVRVEKQLDGWSYIATPEGYHGWVPAGSVVSRTTPYEGSVKTSRLTAFVYGIQDTERGPITKLPYGSKLQVLDATDARWLKIAMPDGREAFIQKGDVLVQAPLSKKGDLVSFSQKFLELPYAWGGRSSFGYDCSGFVQMLYSQIGINLQRDARQQVVDTRFKTIELDQLEPGDLIFWGKSEQKIMHVGMYIGEGKFIQSTVRENKPWIRISCLTDPEWSGSSGATYPYRIARQLIAR
jgi:gamma-D-glutamyl-L-lysine dipeptidyl-peptidase